MHNNKLNNTYSPTYNNCFTLGGKRKQKNENFLKIPMYIDQKGVPQAISGSIDEDLGDYLQLPYEKASKILKDYVNGDYHTRGDESLRISLYLSNAKFGDLHMFVMDFDEYDESSEFFKAATQLADKVTRSQGGGYHMFYGINKEVATPLFDSVNLLASKSAPSYISKVGATTLDGKNKVDMFCDARRFIYEWEEWDNSVGLTDKTQELYELIRDNFELIRPMDFDEWENAENGWDMLEGLPEYVMRQSMTEKQQKVFDDLKTHSSDCPRGEWYSTGIDIYHVFGDELGGSVFLWWSKPGRTYNPSGCVRTWNSICRQGPKTRLRNSDWWFAISAF